MIPMVYHHFRTQMAVFFGAWPHFWTKSLTVDDDSPHYKVFFGFSVARITINNRLGLGSINGILWGTVPVTRLICSYIVCNLYNHNVMLGPHMPTYPTWIPTALHKKSPRNCTIANMGIPVFPIMSPLDIQLYHHVCWYVLPFGASTWQSEIPKK